MIVTEEQFRCRLVKKLVGAATVKSVVGPGRSGAVAAVYASHLLGVPFIPYGQTIPEHLKPTLVIDTARNSGRTMRKAMKKYSSCVSVVLFDEPPRVHFWYEE